MHLRLLIALVLTLGLLPLLPAQRASFSDVAATYFNKSGTLYTEGQISGYYIVNYRKTSKKDGYYVLQLLDQDLNKVGEKSFADKTDVSLGSVAYNGSLLAVEMYDHDKERKWIEFFDGNGEFQHRRGLKYGPYDTPEIRASMAMFDSSPLVAVPGGFLYYSTNTTGKNITSQMTYRVAFIPDDPEAEGWGTRSSSKSKDHEGALHLANNDELVIFGVFKRSGLLSTKFTMEVQGYDLQTGKRRFTYAPDEKSVQTRFLGARITDDGVVLVGLNTGKRNKIFTDVPEAIDIVSLNGAGAVQKQSSISLEDDLSKFLDVNSKGKVKGMGNIFIHDIGMTDGQDLLIAAEFYRTLNGDVKVLDGALIQITPDLTVAGVEIVEKGKSGSLGGSLLSGGISLAKGSTVAAIAKGRGAFDFAFLNDGADAITAAYFGGRSEVRKTNQISLYVHTLLDGELMSDKIVFPASTDRVLVLPAKEGYVAVIEYDQDAKSLDVHMERLSI
jgi:hypothetical protein